MKFRRKSGTAGWPAPQARYITTTAQRYGIHVREQHAQTGTLYLTLTPPEKPDGSRADSITVRCADHADAYATADYSVDPAEDQMDQVTRWIRENGLTPKRRVAIDAQRVREIVRAQGLTSRRRNDWMIDVYGSAADPRIAYSVIFDEHSGATVRVDMGFDPQYHRDATEAANLLKVPVA
jgi:hypothetical protein